MKQLLQYPGSKGRMAKQIIELFPPHRTYVEVFGGSGAVLMTKEPSEVEVYNDINDDIVNLFRVVRDARQVQQLEEMLDFTPYARAEFTQTQKNLPKHKYDEPVEHARLTFVSFNEAFSGLSEKDNSWSYGTKVNQSVGFRASVAALKDISARLANVQIDCGHFKDVLERYDSDDTVFYLDPPYDTDTREKNLYKHEMFLHEHRELVNLILELKGFVILSGYDTPLYAPLEDVGFTRIEISAVMTMAIPAIGKGLERKEVIWMSPSNDRRQQTKRRAVKPETNQLDFLSMAEAT
jgi:DNA adenine methylase